jgi:hypothetical protein
MQLAIADNYQTMIELLSGLVKRHLSNPAKRFSRAKVNERTFLLVSTVLEQEDDEHTDFELTAELLGTREFKQLHRTRRT